MRQGSQSVIPGQIIYQQNACAIDEALIETHQNTVVNVREASKALFWRSACHVRAR